MIVDQEQRDHALDVAHSFIVQAPAGSGKTGLLTRRLLALLANAVEQPEEILAITFTKKAAAEMRERLVAALANAATEPEPEQEPALTDWRLARAALVTDQQRGWQLLENPNRLRIQTIDSFCASLTRQLPVVAEFGAPPAVQTDCSDLYQSAAEATLLSIDTLSDWQAPIATLLDHLDNDFGKTAGLIAMLLARRDQWLHHVVSSRQLQHIDPERLRHELEDGLRLTIEQVVRDAQNAWQRFIASQQLETTLLQALRFAVAQPDKDEQFNALALWLETQGSTDDLACWQCFAQWLMTAKQQWRSPGSIKKNQGFPPPSGTKDKTEKELRGNAKTCIKTVLECLHEQTSPEVLQAFQHLLVVPQPGYSESQWRVIGALLDVLLLAVAQLKQQFEQQGVVDFSEVSQGALRALGDEESPSDLALRLDYRIQHILVDEFQDTSVSQFRLLEALVRGWDASDSRTLFLVGDPMQSIYRFREADVSLFLKVKESGIGNVQPDFLQLATNFRSKQGIIEWVNQAFAQVFPAQDSLETGAISYSPSETPQSAKVRDTRHSEWAEGVHSHSVVKEQGEAQAKTHGPGVAGEALRLIKTLRREHGDESIAILVKARSHLQQVLSEMKAAGIPYQAVEIDPLARNVAVQDALSLTLALCHPGDRLAWFALLRSPLVGMDLTDLTHLAEGLGDRPVAQALSESWLPRILNSLNSDGQQRIQHLAACMIPKLRNRGRMRLRRWVESTWIDLGGPNVVPLGQADNMNAFWDLLDQVEEEGAWPERELMAQKVGVLYAKSSVNEANPVQVMTAHKSKGLEFDHVLVLGMEKGGRGDDAPLFLWSVQENLSSTRDYLLLAPIKSAYQQQDATYQYLRHLDKQKSEHELRRLLYVIATRAKRSLHWFAELEWQQEKSRWKPPTNNTFLQCLADAGQWQWPNPPQEEDGADRLDPSVMEPVTQDAEQSTRLADTALPSRLAGRRLKTRYQRRPIATLPHPSMPTEPEASSVELRMNTAAEFPDARRQERQQAGTLLHSILQQLIGLAPERRQFPDAQLLQQLLVQDGIAEARAEPLARKLYRALSNMAEDETGRWLLQAHEDDQQEWALSFLPRGAVTPQQWILDRSFIAPPPGETHTDEKVRWVVDYKFVEDDPDAAGMQQLVEQYRPQLLGYGQALQSRSSLPIWLGLYFPLQQSWSAWPLPPAGGERIAQEASPQQDDLFGPES